MHFALTQEQELARAALRELLGEHCSAAQLRRVFESEQPACVPELWQRLHELGVIGALAPEAVGGLGLSAIDLAVLLEETGRAAVPELVVETAAVAVPLLAALNEDSRAAAALQRVLAGELAVAVVLGDNRLISNAELAGAVLYERSGELHLLEIQQLQLSPQQTVDRARRLYRIDPDPVTLSAERLDAASAARSQPSRAAGGSLLASGERVRQLSAAAHDHAALGTAAQLLGLGARMLELTIAHVKTRKQFGQAVGAFQAVKHQLVDARLALEFASPLVYRAAHSLAHADAERSLHVSMAKAFASEAALLSARKALQLHGAIGYSYEHELHLYMKRAWALAAAHGDAREHRKRIADIMLTREGDHRHA
jgi:alkylation response protein AidB-like acyl-CoA dehydrogenase